MIETLTTAKEQFLDLVNGAKELDERLVVSNFLKDAGFQVTCLIKKRVNGTEITGPTESELYHANPNSGWEALDAFGRNIPGAWLEYFWKMCRSKSRSEATNFLTGLFALCPMADAVYITEHWEAVIPNFQGVGKPQATDDSPLSVAGLIIHPYCNGWVDIQEVSPSRNVILCRQCKLRVYIPKSIITWGDLRKHFAQFNENLTREQLFERGKPVSKENGWVPTGHMINATGVEALALPNSSLVWGCPATQSLIASPGIETTPIKKSE